MATGIDHLVIAVHDLDTTTRHYTDAGSIVTEGSERKSGASKNVLVAISTHCCWNTSSEHWCQIRTIMHTWTVDMEQLLHQTA